MNIRIYGIFVNELPWTSQDSQKIDVYLKVISFVIYC